MPYSILIVEDDLTFATMLKTWLGKKGFLVDTAGNSARARKQLDAQSYNLCFQICVCRIKTVFLYLHG